MSGARLHQIGGGDRALKLEDVDAVFRIGEFAHAVDHQLRPLRRMLYIVGGLSRLAGQGVDQHLQQEADVVGGAGAADRLHEVLLVGDHVRVGVRSVPGQQLDAVGT